MNRREFLQLSGGVGVFALSSFTGGPLLSAGSLSGSSRKILGMYVHEGWPYNHPYAARTWTLNDWRGYADGLTKLGFDTIIIWPAIEIMPQPLLASDAAHLKLTAQMIKMLRREFPLRVYVTLCPNVVAYPQVADKYPFESRPLFAATTLLNPADNAAVTKMIAWREQVLRPMAEMDGLVLIDSDPSGYPGSDNAQFADLMDRYRKMLNRLRPGIELVYWMHMGWEAMSRYEKTGVFHWGNPSEAEDILHRLKKLNMDPWRITIHTYDAPPNGTDLKLAKETGLASTALAFNYGAIEGEPSFPMTNFGGVNAYRAGQFSAPGGVVGNAQTHCVQLPNTYAFAQGGLGKPLPREEAYVAFADKLIPGRGEVIVAGWKALSGSDAAAMRTARDKLNAAAANPLMPGPLKGLLFGDPHRFVTDLLEEMELKAAFEDFVTATTVQKNVKKTFANFVAAAVVYQRRTGYQCVWNWPKMDVALETLNSPAIDAIVNEKNFVKELLAGTAKSSPGGPYHNVYSDGLMKLETSTPRLIAAMQETLKHMQ